MYGTLFYISTNKKNKDIQRRLSLRILEQHNAQNRELGRAQVKVEEEQVLKNKN